MLETPGRLHLRELREPLRGGSTRPWLAVACDDHGTMIDVVVKLRDPGTPLGGGHYRGTSLACELICSVLARYLGLSVPDYSVVEVEDVLVRAMPSGEIQHLFSRNLGENFCTRYLPSLALWNSRIVSSSPSLIEGLEDLMAFDATVINGDRKREKPNLLYRGSEVVLIDHSVAIPVHLWRDVQIEESPLFPEEQVNAHCAAVTLRQSGQQYGRPFENWPGDDDDSESLIDEVMAMIPEGWEHKKGDLNKIARFLKARPARFVDISSDLARILR